MEYIPTAQSDHFWVVLGSPWTLAILYLALINLAAFCAFGLDKWKARRKAKNPDVPRIPERTLFLLAILGGSLGAWLGMQVFHHKTLHNSFRYGIPAILVVQVLLLFAVLFRHQFL